MEEYSGSMGDTLHRPCVRLAVEQVTGELWTAFMAWAAQQERVTYYKAMDNNNWTIEWFNEKGGFQFKEGTDLVQLIEEILKHGK